MTNETTASQPKSIGDDAQFLTLLSQYYSAADTGCFDNKNGARASLVAYIDSKLRAPAAQASATIQAAPRTSFADYWWEARHERRTQEDHAKAAWDFALKSAATIQEPAMVAEPVGEAKPYSCETGQIDEALANFLAEHTRLNQDGIDSHAMTMTLALNYAAINPTPESDIAEWREQGYLPLAAPMVADPAGVVDVHAIDEIMLAMQVAAEKLEWIAAGLAPGKDYDLDGCRVTATIWHAKQMASYALSRLQPARILARKLSLQIDAAATVKTVPSEALDWISVKDRLPELVHKPGMTSTRVQVLAARDYLPGDCCQMSYVPSGNPNVPGAWHFGNGETLRFGPTHWKPLPPGPNAAPLADKTGGGE